MIAPSRPRLFRARPAALPEPSKPSDSATASDPKSPNPSLATSSSPSTPTSHHQHHTHQQQVHRHPHACRHNPCDPTMASSVRTLHALQPDLAINTMRQQRPRLFPSATISPSQCPCPNQWATNGSRLMKANHPTSKGMSIDAHKPGETIRHTQHASSSPCAMIKN
ncbi:hypothetical protein ACLOJK_014976 [Asimina triloba]